MCGICQRQRTIFSALNLGVFLCSCDMLWPDESVLHAVCSRVFFGRFFCNPPVRCVALEIVGTAVQRVNASRLDVYTTRSLFLVQFVELTYLRTFSFLVIMWLACSETEAEYFLGQCSQTPPGHGQPHRILCQCSCCEDTASFAVFWVRWGGIYS